MGLLWLGTACQPLPKAQASLKLYAFDCGRLNFDSLEPFFGIPDTESDIHDLIVPCYVIEHEKGRLLWNGGLPSSTKDVGGWQEMDGGWRMRLDATLSEQLVVLNLTMADFDYVAFSHFHFDHVGVANELEGATLILQQTQYNTAFADSVTTPGFMPDVYSKLKEAEQIIIDGEHDVFGDGRVRIIPAPGHTHGHQVLYVDLAETGPVVLSGDLYVLRYGLEHNHLLSLDADTTQSKASMKRVEALLEETGATLWIEHELAQFEQLRKPPQYHQ